MASRHDDISLAGGVGDLRFGSGALQHADCGLDRNDMLGSCHVLYLGAHFAPQLRYNKGGDGVHHQSHHLRYGTCDGLGRSAFRTRLRQVEGDRADSYERRKGRMSVYRRVAVEHRVQGQGDNASGHPRHVYSRGGQRACRRIAD